jgi:ABC-type proline/glycine betaine transport system permease subunit
VNDRDACWFAAASVSAAIVAVMLAVPRTVPRTDSGLRTVPAASPATTGPTPTPPVLGK